MGKFTFNWGHRKHFQTTWVSVMNNLHHSDWFRYASRVAHQLNRTAGEQLAHTCCSD